MRSVLDSIAALKRPAFTLLLASVLLAAASAGGPHTVALAAWGGRVGGSAFFSRSSSPPSYGYSAPAPRGGQNKSGPRLQDDIMRLYQPVHLLVGTPGRILDLTRKGICVLKDCSMLVVDEADKLLALEFQPSVEALIHFLPP